MARRPVARRGGRVSWEREGRPVTATVCARVAPPLCVLCASAACSASLCPWCCTRAATLHWWGCSTRRGEGAPSPPRSTFSFRAGGVVADRPPTAAPLLRTHTHTRFHSTHSHPPTAQNGRPAPLPPAGAATPQPQPPPRATGGAAPTTTARGGAGELVALPCWTRRLVAAGLKARPRRARLARRAGAAARQSETARSPAAAAGAPPRGGA